MLSPAQIAAARRGLAEDGVAVLRGFVAPARAAAMLAEVEPALDKAFSQLKTHNVYLLRDDPALPPDHPRNAKVTTSSATLAHDLIPEGGLRDLYDAPALRAGLAEILGFPALYPYADPLAGLNVLTYAPGTETGWHFDNASFVVTLMLRPAAAGGHYDYLPGSRPEADDGHATVARVLAGDLTGLRRLDQQAGDLVVFRGQRTLHRVTPVEGDLPRVIAVLSYAEAPGKTLHEDTRRTFYGRAA